jgi:hypothetical protein
MGSENKGRKEICYEATWKAFLSANPYCRVHAKLRPGKSTKIPISVPSCDQDVQ